MCLNCPQYLKHLHNLDLTGDWKMSCSDVFESNASLMGGYPSIARAIAMAVEYQKETTPHTHGLAALSTVYSHNTLPVIASMLEENIQDARRAKRFINHLERSSCFNVEDHNKNLDHIEK